MTTTRTTTKKFPKVTTTDGRTFEMRTKTFHTGPDAWFPSSYECNKVELRDAVNETLKTRSYGNVDYDYNEGESSGNADVYTYNRYSPDGPSNGTVLSIGCMFFDYTNATKIAKWLNLEAAWKRFQAKPKKAKATAA